MNENDKNFVGYAIAECVKKGVSVYFKNKDFVWTDNTKCSGFFDENNKIIVVATKKSQKNFFPIFVHEFCHFQQWSEEDPVFLDTSNNIELDSDMWNWLEGEKVPMSRVRKSILAYQKLELDCEKRVIQKIKDFGLSIEMNNYIKMANVYVLFYSLLLKTRKWYYKPPYNSSKLLKIIPNEFITSFEIPEKFEKIAYKECY